jgi:PAS domain S-box-containing protein
LREVCPWSEVVLITGFATLDTALQALASGAFAFILKSFRPEELISTVEQAITKVELKREREDLERRYRDVVEVADVVVVALDAELHVALFNRKASQLAAISGEEAIGRSFLSAWISERERGRVEQALRLIREDGVAREVEADFCADPGVREEPVARYPATALQRRIRWHFSYAGTHVYGLGIDVTERLALERRAREHEALSAMGGLAMNLAHEIRNPLNAAVLQLHLLSRQIEKLGLEQELAFALKDRTRIVGDEIARLNRMLTEFLELARPRGIVLGPVDLNALVHSVLELQADTLQSHSICIQFKPRAEAFATGDVEKLNQVVLNLVVNAIEAMREGGTLSLSIERCEEHLWLEVSDSGPGIDPAVAQSIFDPFFTTKEAGTGLGLSIVRKIVEQHQGIVRIEPREPRGTRVLIRLPAAGSAPRAPQNPRA